MGTVGVIPVRPDLDALRQPGFAENFGQGMQLRNLMQNAPLQRQILEQQAQAGQLENQQRQQQLQDQQAVTAAMKNWDGKDINDLPGMVLKQGGSAQAVFGLKNQIVEQRQKLATASTDELNNQAKQNDMIVGHIEAIKSAPDDQKQAVYDGIRQSLGPMALRLPQQYPGDDALTQFEKQFQGGKQMFDQEMERRKTAATESEAATKATEATTSANRLQAEMPGGPLNRVTQDIQVATNPQIQQGKEQVAAVEGQARANAMGQMREYPVFDNQTKTTVMLNSAEINAANQAQPGRYTAPGYTPEAIGQKGTTTYFTSGKGGQQLTAFNTAMNHLDTLDKLAGDLNNSNLLIFNKAAQAWAEQTGNPAPANFAAAKNAMSGEVAAALKASGATDQEITKVGETFNRAQSPAQLKGAINTYRGLLQGKAQNLQQQYQQGMQGKPNFQGQGGSIFARDPQGKLHQAPAGTPLPPGWKQEQR